MSTLKIKFISLNEKWVNSMKIFFEGQGNVTIENADIKTMPRSGVAFVSPANEMGFMDGGIDIILNRVIFPNIQKDVQKKISEVGFSTALGRKYINVGSAVLVAKGNSVLICAPTMYQPEDVSHTNNAYSSFLAALLMLKKYNAFCGNKIHSMVVTSHCCGYGRMPESVSALQMYNAYHDFVTGNCGSEIARASDPFCLLMPSAN